MLAPHVKRALARRPPAPAASPDRHWVSRSTPKDHLLARLRPPDEETSKARLAGAALPLLVAEQSAASTTRVEFRTQRVVRSGFLYEARCTATYQERGETTDLRLTVQGAEGPPLTYWAEIQHGDLVRKGVEVPGRDGATERRPLALGSTLPFGIGDLDLRDVLLLHEALGDPDLQPEGILKAPKSAGLVVFDVDLAGPPGGKAGGAAPASYPTQGASALVYAGFPGLRIQVIRVFDAEGWCVRVYEDFEFDPDSPGMPRRFRVESIPSTAHTVFEILDIVLED